MNRRGLPNLTPAELLAALEAALHVRDLQGAAGIVCWLEDVAPEMGARVRAAVVAKGVGV